MIKLLHISQFNAVIQINIFHHVVLLGFWACESGLFASGMQGKEEKPLNSISLILEAGHFL